ncbi:MAG: TOBE domain-containing protein, partial [Paracoccaceae bacterium]
SVSIRSELVSMSTGPEPASGLAATYRETVYLGLTTSHRVSLADGSDMMARVVSDGSVEAPEPGTAVTLTWPHDAARLHLN